MTHNNLTAAKGILIILLIFFASGIVADAAEYSQPYRGGDGQLHDYHIVVDPGNHTFRVTGVPKSGSMFSPGKRVEWFINNQYQTTQNIYSHSSDPSYSYGQSSGIYTVRAEIFEGDWTWLESHFWNVTVSSLKPDLIVQDIILTPTQVYVGQNQFSLKIIGKNIGAAQSGPCGMKIQILSGAGLLNQIITSVPPLSPNSSYIHHSYPYIFFPSPGQYVITIRAYIDWYNVVDESNEDNNELIKHFIITVVEPKELFLLAPNGGEEFIVGNEYLVEWQTYGNIPEVNLDVSLDNGTTWEILESGLANTNQYTWIITEDWISPNALLRVSDSSNPSNYDQSSATFEIFVCTLEFDLDGNCFIDMNDLALLASEWLKSGNPYRD